MYSCARVVNSFWLKNVKKNVLLPNGLKMPDFHNTTCDEICHSVYQRHVMQGAYIHIIVFGKFAVHRDKQNTIFDIGY